MNELTSLQKGTLAIVPARGGSKGIVRKNLQVVAGETLVGHAIRFARDCGLFETVHLSTDDQEIADEGDRYGCKPRFLRSTHSSGDRASATDVVREVRNQLLSEGKHFERYVLLEPTSPMRTVECVAGAIKLTQQQFDAALTVSPIDQKFHADKQFSVAESGAVAFMTERGSSVVARQQLTQTYIRNGFCYVVMDRVIEEGGTILGFRPGAFICNGPFVNIDTAEELEHCRRLMEQSN